MNEIYTSLVYRAQPRNDKMKTFPFLKRRAHHTHTPYSIHILFIILLYSPHLLFLLLLDSTGCEDITGSSMLVFAVLERKLAESSNHVLNGRVLAVTVLATELIEPSDAVKQIVDNGDDDSDTDGVSPDNNNGDNVNPAVITELAVGLGVGLVWLTRHPAEDSEDGSEGIDTENGTNKLEGRERLAATGDEDEPVLSEGNFEEENGLDSTEVLDDTTVGEEEGATDDPGTESEEQTQND